MIQQFRGVVADQLCILLLQVMKEIVQAAQQHQGNDSVGAIVITGEGNKAFAAGADIKEMASQSYSQVGCRCLKTFMHVMNLAACA